MKKKLLSFRTACFVLLSVMVFSGISSMDANAAAQVRISKKNFPDKVFRSYVKKFDKNKNGYLSKKEIRAVKELIIENGAGSHYSRYSNAPKLDMKGMEYFTSVQKVNIWWYHLKNFDTRKMKKLKSLDIAACYQKELDLRKNKELGVLDLCGNNVSKIKFASPSKLKLLSIFREEKLKKPDFSKLKKLETLQADQMPYKSLNLRNCKQIKKLVWNDGALKEISVGKANVKLETIIIDRCKLASINVSQLKKLKELDLQGNHLKKINVAKNSTLEELNCDENNLTTLNVSQNSQLERLFCEGNLLKSIDVSRNSQLNSLWCDKNNISTLDVSGNSKLDSLSCSENHLTELNLAQNSKLLWLCCDRNNISSLDLSKNVKLEELRCSKNPLKSLDVSMLTQLGYLNCKDCQITVLKQPSNKGLIVESGGNPLK